MKLKLARTIRTLPEGEVSRTLELLVAMANLIAETSAENLRTLQQVDQATRQIKRQNDKLIALYELNQLLQSPLSLEEKLLVILTSLTSAQGFGFHRAMLFLLNEEMTLLEGRMGVGPATAEEAEAARQECRGCAEPDLLERLRNGEVPVRPASVLDRRTRELRFSTRDKGVFPVAALFHKGPRVVRNRGTQADAVHPALKELLGPVANFVAIPLVENETPIGVIVADMRFPRKRIDKEALQILSIFSNQAATAVSNSKLYSILQEKIFQLAESNRQLQKAHKRLMQMERFSILGSVAAGVAHEIKNPLNAIVIYLELLKGEVAKEHPEKEKIREKLKVVEEEIARLSDLAAEFLSYSTTAPLETQPIDLRILLNQVIRFIRYQAKEQGVTIRKSFAAELPEIAVNHKQMKQVFLNIILNALEAMPQGGRLTVSVGPDRDHGDRVRVAFTDTGVGISEEVRARMFEPFYTTRKGGSGLGLSFVEKVIRDHQGEIQVQSARGKGTTMLLYLPGAGVERQPERMAE